MSKQYPFHYEVRFKLLAIDENNKVENRSHVKVFDDELPLENRKKAFEEFDEYLAFLKLNGRLAKDNQGNFYITQPEFISEILNDFDEMLNSNNYSDDEFHNMLEVRRKALVLYREEIGIYLVVEDLDISKNVLKETDCNDNVETEFVIHLVSSEKGWGQDLVDNLAHYEVPLYEHFKINIDGLKETVYHYSTDYAESGEDEEDGAKRVILRTPFVWDDIEKYNARTERINSKKELDQIEPELNLDWLMVIRKGESNQVEFKPSLLYNFRTKKGGIGVKNIIAKAICGFLNSNGGVLLIGVNDDGSINGLHNSDYTLFEGGSKKDKLFLEVDSLLAYFFGLSIKPLISSEIIRLFGKDILVIKVEESYRPVFLSNDGSEESEKTIYIRMNASTRQLTDKEELVNYVFNKQWKKPPNSEFTDR